ncbi:MAG: hypothetical protein GC190_11505 [Alphaproteobacteria bacterium]|nr:hypothetical protein [Alphaproteobacteria bacterium]
MRPLLPLIITLFAACCALSGHAAAADGWHATQVAGEVRVEIGNAPAVPLTVAMSIDRDALIETAASGSATLVRGEEHVTVAPNSRLRLPVDDGSGFTRVIEEFGHLFFQVGKKTTPHFRVETPLLAATVKGTTFSVTVDHKGANVDVSEGLVLVQNKASMDSTYVAAGRSANVILTQPETLYLDHSIVPPTGIRLRFADGELADAARAASAAAPEQASNRTVAQNRPRTSARDQSSGGLAFSTPTAEAPRSPATIVIDSTLSGIGVGILAAALAIILIGLSRRQIGLVAAKITRAAKKDQGEK